MNTKKLVIIGMLSALAYILMVVGRFPLVSIEFLKYDPKDIVIAIGGFLFGPLTVLFMSVVVSLLEMFTVSGTGIIGFIMNVLATCAFICPAAYIYQRKRSRAYAVMGLIIGVILMTITMLLWNYFITPIYMGYPRETVAAMLAPTFLPFNLMKGGINAAVIMLVYKPVTKALSASGLHSDKTEIASTPRVTVGISLVSALVLISCVLMALVYNGVI